MDESIKPIKANFWGKLQSISLTIVAIMFSFGQWHDTKNAIGSAYDAFVTHWTHDIEYQQISAVHVGQTQDYVIGLLGNPHVSKKSKLDPELAYFYYGYKKYQLMLAIKDQRLSGYAVVALNSDFHVPIAHTEHALLTMPLEQYFPKHEYYFSDANNIEYYAESYDLGKRVMFYNLVLGAVNYDSFTTSALASVKSLNTQLDRAVEEVSATLAENRKLSPNYFAITELEPRIMVEGLLTYFEYKTLLKID